MLVSDFDFELPERLIALRPAVPRESARLLVVPAAGAFEDRTVADLPELLRSGDVLVFNDTRVIPARLAGVRERDGHRVAVEATLLKRTGVNRWTALMRPGKRLSPGDRLFFPDEGRLDATLEAKGEDGEVTIAFDIGGPDLDRAIDVHGHMPLPPYIAARRPEDAQDRADYQTAYARLDGSVAAPTAGLHFTPDLLARLDARGIERRFVTLHVGAGTFLPMKAERTEDHRMHPEWGEVCAETAAALNVARSQGRRIVCVGTTSLRLLESACDEAGRFIPFAGETDIFITPPESGHGRPIRAADGLMSNFHLPRSTLIMLVSAVAGLARTQAAYAHAITQGYRFYSYGDASLWWRT